MGFAVTKTIRSLLQTLKNATPDDLLHHSYHGLTPATIEALKKRDVQTYTGKVRDVVSVPKANGGDLLIGVADDGSIVGQIPRSFRRASGRPSGV